MTPGQVTTLKLRPDRRFKPGRITVKNGEIRGHPHTVGMKVYSIPPPPPDAPLFMRIDHDKFMAAPPIVITEEMANVLKGSI